MADAATRSFLRRILPKLALSIALGALFGWLVWAGGVPLIPKRAAFDHVAWWAVPAYLGTLFVTHFVRATRWRFLIAPVRELPLKEVVALNWIGFFAIFALPLRLGEVARPALTKLRHGISVSVGFGTIAVERVVDGLITSLCVAWALFALPHLETTDRLARALPFYGYLALTVFGGAFVALGVFLWQRSWAVGMTERCFGLVSQRLGKLVAEKVDGVAEGIRSLASLRLTLGFLFETAIYWGMNAAGMWVLARGCGVALDPGHAVALMGILAIGILLPTGPGLFGNFQLAMSTGLRLYFAEAVVGAEGAVFIFLLYVMQSVVILLAGVIPLYAMNLRLGDLLGTEQLRQGLSVPPPSSPAP
ncbi:MAG: flippase-like domain-containing protein [Myxococcales bacterium]|nr:flippase-like domain-containing protein [Myxococcales bacterium]